LTGDEREELRFREVGGDDGAETSCKKPTVSLHTLERLTLDKARPKMKHGNEDNAKHEVGENSVGYKSRL
jgi:hypothetical protein